MMLSDAVCYSIRIFQVLIESSGTNAIRSVIVFPLAKNPIIIAHCDRPSQKKQPSRSFVIANYSAMASD
ncbi:hypothetical protein ABKN59_009178 [Abortiporus biennis]